MARPSVMTAKVQGEILDRLTAGESLRTICDSEGMPDASNVFRFLAKDENAEFREQYARAREAQADALFDDILSIADDGRNDWMLRNHGETQSWVENGEALRRSQLRIDARKWMAGKLQPKKYGDKITQEVTGANGAPLVPVINLTGRAESSSSS